MLWVPIASALMSFHNCYCHNNNQIPEIPIPAFPTFTSTVLKTTSLIVTTGLIKSCIDGTQFSIANGVRSTQSWNIAYAEEMEAIDALAPPSVET